MYFSYEFIKCLYNFISISLACICSSKVPKEKQKAFSVYSGNSCIFSESYRRNFLEPSKNFEVFRMALCAFLGDFPCNLYLSQCKFLNIS